MLYGLAHSRTPSRDAEMGTSFAADDEPTTNLHNLLLNNNMLEGPNPDGFGKVITC